MKKNLKRVAMIALLSASSQLSAVFMPGVELPPEFIPEEKQVQLDAEFVCKASGGNEQSKMTVLNIHSQRLFKAAVLFKQDVNLDLIEDFYLKSPFEKAVPFFVKQQDVNEDGFADLVCYFYVKELFPAGSDVKDGDKVTLAMNILYDGTLFTFNDSVAVKVPKGISEKSRR